MSACPNELPPWLRHARTVGNLLGVLMFFSIITLFVASSGRNTTAGHLSQAFGHRSGFT